MHRYRPKTVFTGGGAVAACVDAFVALAFFAMIAFPRMQPKVYG
jgi:hypothetical protein